MPCHNFSKEQGKVVLALGPELKANFCVIKNRTAFLYYDFGDLKIPAQFNFYRRFLLRTIAQLKIKPQIIAHDLNPVFLSSNFAQELKNSLFRETEILPVQHHFAHIVSNLAYHNLRNKKVIGVACDGTGFGRDGRVWGFEFLICDFKRYQRMAHLNYIALPGSDMSVKEPWRVAVALLFQSYQNKLFSSGIPWLRKKKYETKILLQMMQKDLNCPLASSAGRLFDGVSALLGLCLKTNFEAEAAILLEKEAEKAKNKKYHIYPYEIEKQEDEYVINTNLLIRAIVADLRRKIRREVIALRFHQAFSDIIIKTCKKIRKETGLDSVALSGGVFFNKIIYELVWQGLKNNKFCVFCLPNFLRGDSGISLGQAVSAYVSGNTGKN